MWRDFPRPVITSNWHRAWAEIMNFLGSSGATGGSFIVEEADTEINLSDIFAGVALQYKGSMNPSDNFVDVGTWEINKDEYFSIWVANICQRSKISTPHIFCCCPNKYFGDTVLFSTNQLKPLYNL